MHGMNLAHRLDIFVVGQPRPAESDEQHRVRDAEITLEMNRDLRISNLREPDVFHRSSKAGRRDEELCSELVGKSLDRLRSAEPTYVWPPSMKERVGELVGQCELSPSRRRLGVHEYSEADAIVRQKGARDRCVQVPAERSVVDADTGQVGNRA